MYLILGTLGRRAAGQTQVRRGQSLPGIGVRLGALGGKQRLGQRRVQAGRARLVQAGLPVSNNPLGLRGQGPADYILRRNAETRGKVGSYLRQGCGRILLVQDEVTGLYEVGQRGVLLGVDQLVTQLARKSQVIKGALEAGLRIMPGEQLPVGRASVALEVIVIAIRFLFVDRYAAGEVPICAR